MISCIMYPRNIKTVLLMILGATYVNVAPGQAPQDIYGEIATLVEEKRASDQSDDTAERHEIATILEGFVRRKVIKQTVMTTVYGVTEYGARLQIEKQLKDIGILNIHFEYTVYALA